MSAKRPAKRKNVPLKWLTWWREHVVLCRPVIIVATANDYQKAYLVNLESERRSLKGALLRANWRSRFNKLVLLPNATAKSILQAIEKHQGRIRVFQYSGHARGAHLQLEDRTLVLANIARALKKEKNLELVFLNGCYSHSEDAENLYREHGCALISTHARINDRLATEFTQRFYQLLGKGLKLGEAFDKSRQGLEKRYPLAESYRDEFEDFELAENRDLEDDEPKASGDRSRADPSQEEVTSWPWQLISAKEILNWRLKRIIWLPSIFAFLIGLLVMALAAQLTNARIKDYREYNDSTLLVTRIYPPTSQRQFAKQDILDSKLLQSVYSLSLALEEKQFHVDYSKVRVAASNNQSCELSVGELGGLEHLSRQHDASMVVYFASEFLADDKVSIQARIFIPQLSSLGEYVNGCQSIAEPIILNLPFSEEEVATQVYRHLRPRLEALGYFLAAIRELENDPLARYSEDPQDFPMLVEGLMRALASDYWPESGLTTSASEKASLYYLAGGYLQDDLQLWQDRDLPCMTAKGTVLVEMMLKDCVGGLLEQAQTLSPNYPRLPLGLGNFYFLLAEDSNPANSCPLYAQGLNQVSNLMNNPDDALRYRATYNLSRIVRRLWERQLDGLCRLMPDSLGFARDMLIPNLKASIEDYRQAPGLRLSTQSALRAILEVTAWQWHLSFKLSPQEQQSQLDAIGQDLKEAQTWSSSLEPLSLRAEFSALISLRQGINEIIYLYIDDNAQHLKNIENYLKQAQSYYVQEAQSDEAITIEQCLGQLASWRSDPQNVHLNCLQTSH
ncbi:MAG: hypothetical protein R2880_14950 [Deinococcales bacterium]